MKQILSFFLLDNGVKMVYCPDCRTFLPSRYFYRSENRPSKCDCYCKTHKKERDRKHREANPEGFRKYMRDYMRNRYEKKGEFVIKKARPVEEVEPVEQVEMFPAKKKKQPCACNRFDRCSECRRREQKQAEKEDRLPVYLSRQIDPAVYQICLAVRGGVSAGDD